MNFKNITHQITTGLIVGLSSIVYAISHGALLFSAGASNLIAIGMTSALITATIFAVGSCFFKEKTFVMGTDSSTVSVMAGMVLLLNLLMPTPEAAQASILAAILLLSITSSLIFYLVARLNLANFVRFVPYSVMAGLLASTGWLMCSGALMIISGVSLSVKGIEDLVKNPSRPELIVGFFIACLLLGLAKKISTAILIPIVIILTSVVIYFFIHSPYCAGFENACNANRWLFSFDAQSAWIPSWQIEYSKVNLYALIRAFPSILVVAFVGVITVLLSVASLELSYKREFNLNQALRVHAGSAIFSTLFGGFVGIISTGRTSLNRVGGGGIISTLTAGLLCFVMLIGGGGLLAFIPRPAMGGVILFLGLSMLKTWMWDQRKDLERAELIEITSILILVANFGYLAGFGLGIAMSCIAFVIACSKNPLISLGTDLSVFSSSVVRHERHRQLISEYGNQSLVFKLNGYVFFGSASNLELIFHEIEKRDVQNILLDFSEVLGIDRSAIGVFHRILRRNRLAEVQFYFVYSSVNEEIVKSIYPSVNCASNVSFYSSLDLAVEAAEEYILANNQQVGEVHNSFDFLDDANEREVLIQYLELKSFMAGQDLCGEGDDSDEIYFIEKGSLEIMKKINDAEVRLTKLSSGAMAGEMAFYTGEVRSATIRASTASQVYVLSSSSLLNLRNAHPTLASKFDLYVIKKLASALIRANKFIASLN